MGGAMALPGANGVRAICAWERRKALEAKLPTVPHPVRIERLGSELYWWYLDSSCRRYRSRCALNGT